MALPYNPFEDEEEGNDSQQNPLQGGQAPLQGNQPPSSGGEQQLTSGESGPISGPAPTTGQAGTPESRRSSGRFTNLQKFLEANKPAQLGQKIGGVIGEQTQEAGQKLQQSRQELESGIGQVKQAREQTFGSAGGAVSQLAGTQPANLQQAEKDIRAARALEYGGPTELAKASELESSKQKLASMGEATGTEAGRFGLLQTLFGKPTYTKGQQKLDQLILQADPNAAKALQEAKGQTQAYQQSLDETLGQSREMISAEQSALEQQRQALEGQVGSTKGAVESDLTKRIEAENAKLIPGAAQVTEKEAIDTLTKRGFDVKRGLNGEYRVQIAPGVVVPVSDVIKKGLVSGKATLASEENLDPEAQGRLNVLRSLTGESQKTFGGPGPGIENILGDKLPSVQQGLQTTLRNSEFGDLSQPIKFSGADTAKNNFGASDIAKSNNLDLATHIVNYPDAVYKGALKGNANDVSIVLSTLTPANRDYLVKNTYPNVLSDPSRVKDYDDVWKLITGTGIQNVKNNYQNIQKSKFRNDTVNKYLGSL